MSRFFRAGSDSESESDDYSESESEQSVSEVDDSEKDSDEGSDDDDQPKKASAPAGKNKFLKGAASDDDSSDEEEVQRKGKKVMRSAKDKRYDDMRSIVKLLNNGKKINDWVAIQNEFDKLNRAYAKTAAVIEREGGPKPRFYFRTLALLEDFVKDTLAPEKKDALKKMNALNAKALNAMKQKVKKHNKTFEADIEAWRNNPVTEEESADEGAVEDDGGDESDDSYFKNQSSDSSDSSDDEGPGGRKKTVLEKFGKRPTKVKEEEEVVKVKKVKAPKKVEIEQKEPEDDGEGGFTAVGKSGKAIEVTPENLFKKLGELLEARGKKSTDKVGQISNFQRLYEVASSPFAKLKVLLALIAAQFDHIPASSGYMPVDVWKSARANIEYMLNLLETNAHLTIADVPEDDELELTELEIRANKGEKLAIRGNIFSFIDRLDEEFTKSLQGIDPHTTEYVDRLRDETSLYVLIVRAQLYFLRIKDQESADLTAMRRVEHLYFKPDSVIAVFENALPAKSASNPGELVHSLCVGLYQTENIRTRARALLCHVYNLALKGDYFRARDMLLMSHLQEQAQHTDVQTQILFNRTMVQLGLCAFRSGLIKDAANALQEISSSGKMKELLAQGFQIQKYSEKTPEQERIEKQRQLPFHMHINLELLECVYLTCSMLLEIPNMAMNSHDSRRKIISKPFRRMLDYNERQVFTGPPENTRDHIMGASRALSNGEWQRCQQLIRSIKIWDLMPEVDKIKDMLSLKIQEEGLRTYLFQYSPFYDSLGLEQLSQMFELPESSVHSIVSKMIINEELNGSLDQPTRTLVLHRPAPGVDMSRLEYLAGVYSEKVASFVENNEKLLESRSIILGLQQQQQQAGQERTGFRGQRSGTGGAGGERSGRGRGGRVGGGRGRSITGFLQLEMITVGAQEPQADITRSLRDDGGMGVEEEPPKQEKSLPLDKLKALTDIAEIKNQLRILNEEENQVDLEIDNIMKSKDEAETRLASLELLRPEIGGLLRKSEDLYKVVAKTSQLAESISGKVRQLDLQQDCAVGVQHAIKENDFETAGQHIHRFLQFDHQVMERIFNSAAAREAARVMQENEKDFLVEDAALILGVGQNIDLGDGGEKIKVPSPMEVLKSAQRILTDIIVEEFDAAVKVKNEANMIRFLKIFPLIGKSAQGLDKHSMYEQTQKATEAAAKGDELTGITLNASSNLSLRVRELMANYATFEEYFIRRSVEKAMKIEEVDNTTMTATSVDDVFYIIKKSVLLNNIDVTCDYMQKLLKEVSHDIEVLYSGRTDEVKSNMKTSLLSISDYASAFKKILMTWVENLFTQTLKPRLRNFIQDSYKDIKYSLTEEEYAEHDAQDLFVKRFMATFSKVIAPYQKSFTERNCNQTVAHCIDSFVKEWERYVVQNFKFSQLGAIRFDKDVRALTSYLTSLTKWSMRDKFARLNQISILLNLDKLSEVDEVWGSKAGGVQWRLSINDAKRFLALRTDFKPEEVAALSL
ncbi:Translation initiation factor 3 subunit c [Phlyctochytrium bullatum]|nr:Translation initiation factor 3 subunit c [Phlyctochytrium bullatum]